MIIGITGGIGSGKSTIAKQLRAMGYAVYDTDSEAKRLIVEDAHVRQQMEQLFGKEVYADGVYQTALVAQRVFASPPFRGETEGGLFFVECAILYQAGIDALCDKVVAVTAPEDIRLSRVIARDRSDIDKVRARMRAQNVEEDLNRADIIINNDGNTPIPILCEQMLKELT